ncbi:dihydrolipoyl dehydrogenase family protein [Hyphococcus luteus]|uniref:Dihydrolipoamide dehydrogenase n=1 Tax=Hyphococcus luteus TaxID=2058213 RepID=A0A2S7K9M1_9PROT|nr:FAD-dependent oxidoreductase [Marinicaulis flavus]PQA89197.1 dihydrolipoamide dehydrogenase [Marinicaulis flavus]
MTRTIKADLCIIGAGSGGLSVAAGAAMLGRKVVLIEKGAMGGDCLNTGCVPSKALIAAAARAQAMREAEKFGIASVEPDIDFAAVMEHVHDVIEAIAPIDSQERFEGLGVTVLRAHAEFTGPREVKAGDAAVKAKHFVIATGSTPFIPPIEGVEDVPYFTNETIFENRRRPDHLIIIGGGPIGVEMAQAHARLGAKVTIIEGGRILGREDPECVEVVRARLVREGVEIIEDAQAEKISKTESGVSISIGAREIDGSHLLIAVGRKPVVDGLNLVAANVAYDDKGLKTDNRLRTTNKRIYAAGDVAGGRQFTHVAGYHASILIRNILFKTPAKNNEHLSPRVTYCDPELAHVGLTEAQARERHGEVRIARWPFAKNDRAEAERETEGFVKAVTDKKGRILGASIVGHNAGDLLQPWVLSLSSKLKIRDFTAMIAPYPTRGEASKRAAGDWYADKLFSPGARRLISLLSIFD